MAGVAILSLIAAGLAACSSSTAPRYQPVAPSPGIQPTSANTGVPAGTRLREHKGDLVITKAGSAYDSLDVQGFVFVRAPNVTITRSIIRGGVADSDTGLVNDVSPRGTHFLITDSDLVPAHPSVEIDGIKGSNYTALRLDIHGTVDGAKVFGNDTTIENSYIHDLVLYPSDPDQQGGPTHNDGVQVLGGSNIHITDNTLSIATEERTALEVSQDFSPTTDLSFDRNWADGAVCTVNLTAKPRASMVGITVDGNHFGPHTQPGCAIIASDKVGLSAVGNVMTLTGRPAAVVITK